MPGTVKGNTGHVECGHEQRCVITHQTKHCFNAERFDIGCQYFIDGHCTHRVTTIYCIHISFPLITTN